MLCRGQFKTHSGLQGDEFVLAELLARVRDVTLMSRVSAARVLHGVLELHHVLAIAHRRTNLSWS